ncbi:protein phosphatase 1 regulatory subunit 36 isoform X2 [Notolabrus celidotus]|uniref:protein phosphatase 1 regulatory subunit 36 isoform X2 n=1 Tax=Notolabrus celidotus TaxID=1203425 RepID=UPI0014902021|nr:protein phosphatase 1 regulatory subunit 36 isoform X2 [Notolabrus celidotus]
MPKIPEVTRHVSVPPSGRWVWNDEAETVEFVSSSPAEEGVTRESKQTNADFRELQLRAEWLADICALNHRGRQSLRKGLSHAQLNAYRSSVMRRPRDHVSIDDVKQVAVRLLQENYSLPIPFSFLAVLKRKELDEVLAALLMCLSCFLDQKSLGNKSKPLIVDIIKERQMMAEALAKRQIAQKKLAVCYFSLTMDVEIEQNQQSSYRKGRMLTNSTEWLLHACLYCFFCFVAWVTFGRKDLKDIQEEVGRLFYSDTFNTAVRSRADGDPEITSAVVDGSMKMGEIDPKETGSNCTFRHRQVKERSFQKCPSLRSTVNQRSPLLVSLLPSPKELSPHLFLGSRARRQSPLPVERCDTMALTEELNQQLADVSFGILGKPLCQFNCSTLIPLGEQQHNSEEEEEDHDPRSNSKGHPGFSFQDIVCANEFPGPTNRVRNNARGSGSS